MCLPPFRHVSIPVFHGCAHLRMTHQLLLHADRRSAGIEHRTVAVPKRMPAWLSRSIPTSCPSKSEGLPGERKRARLCCVWVGRHSSLAHSPDTWAAKIARSQQPSGEVSHIRCTPSSRDRSDHATVARVIISVPPSARVNVFLRFLRSIPCSRLSEFTGPQKSAPCGN